MRYGYTILNQSVNVLKELRYQKNALLPSIVKRQRRVKIPWYVIFYENKSSVIQLPVPKDRSVTGAFYKNAALKKLKPHLKKRHPKTGLKHLHLMPIRHAFRPSFFESEKVNVLPRPPFSPDLAPCDYFLFPKLKFHMYGKKDRS